MTTPHRTLQMALDALDAITDDVDGTGLNTMPSFDKAIDAITALREAMASPEPEPVAWKHDCAALCTNDVELWIDACPHCGKPRTAPPAAPAVPLTIDQEKALSAEAKTGPFQHTTPIFGNDMQSGETPRLSSNRHAGSTPPAAPAPAAPVPDGWVMVPREPTPEMLAVVRNGPMHETWTEGYCAMIAAAPAAPVVPLTDSELAKIAVEDEFLLYCDQDSFNEIARAIEAAHGITGGGNG